MGDFRLQRRVKRSLKQISWRWIADNRDLMPLRTAARLASGFLNAYNARGDYIIAQSGEERLVRIIGKHLNRGVFLDVGANIGDWTEVVLRHVPAGQVYAFEPGSEAGRKLKMRFEGNSRVEIISSAAADAVGEVNLFVPVGDTVIGSLHQHRVSHADLAGVAICTEVVNVTTLDSFCAQRGISEVAMLKIDAEGSDHLVLQGARRLFEQQRVRVASFEYFGFAIETRFLLADFYAFFESVGYSVGKVFPRSVEFGPYSTALEDFRGLNFVAVRGDSQDLLEQLSGAQNT